LYTGARTQPDAVARDHAVATVHSRRRNVRTRRGEAGRQAEETVGGLRRVGFVRVDRAAAQGNVDRLFQVPSAGLQELLRFAEANAAAEPGELGHAGFEQHAAGQTGAVDADSVGRGSAALRRERFAEASKEGQYARVDVGGRRVEVHGHVDRRTGRLMN